MASLDLMVLDGEARMTLGVVRSFFKRGLSVAVGSSHSFGRANFSRGIKHHFIYDPGNVSKAHSVVRKHVIQMRPKVLMPINDYGWSIVYNNYSDYRDLTKVVPNPGKELFNNLQDKSFLTEISEKLGVSFPVTYRPATFDDANSIRNRLSYPVLLKPRVGVGGSEIRRVDEKDQFCDTLAKYNDVPIIQQIIEGEDLELTLLCVHGEPIAGSAYLSLRNAPLPYGPPSACRTIEDKKLMDIGIGFLRKLNYNGAAHLDFRRDRNDNQIKLLDFNVRLAGTNDISLCSGTDFAYMLYKMALGQNVKPSFRYELGKEFRWYLFNELRYLAKFTPKWRVVRDHLKWKNVSTDISLRDPLPSLVRIAELMKKIWYRQ